MTASLNDPLGNISSTAKIQLSRHTKIKSFLRMLCFHSMAGLNYLSLIQEEADMLLKLEKEKKIASVLLIGDWGSVYCPGLGRL